MNVDASNIVLIWDEWNTQHIAKHSVTSLEVEFAISDIGKRVMDARNGRYMVIGRSAGRILAIILNRNLNGRYYVLSARDACKKERSYYRKEDYELKKDNKNA